MVSPCSTAPARSLLPGWSVQLGRLGFQCARSDRATARSRFSPGSRVSQSSRHCSAGALSASARRPGLLLDQLVVQVEPQLVHAAALRSLQPARAAARVPPAGTLPQARTSSFQPRAACAAPGAGRPPGRSGHQRAAGARAESTALRDRDARSAKAGQRQEVPPRGPHRWLTCQPTSWSPPSPSAEATLRRPGHPGATLVVESASCSSPSAGVQPAQRAVGQALR